MESARRVQDELRMKHTIKNVTGCTLALQVLYLDSLDICKFSLPRDKLPRIALFDVVILKRMINADQENNISYCNTDTSGASAINDTNSSKTLRFDEIAATPSSTSSQHVQLPYFRTLQPAVSTYLTAYLRGSIEQKLSYGQVDALKWHNARMIHHVRKTKELLLEGGPINLNEEGIKLVIEVHMEALMANIFQDNLSLSQKLHTHASTNVAGGVSHLKETSSLQVSSNYSSIRSERPKFSWRISR
ncbi:uncharacterized protein LOC124655407 [Lolium rigidum]|uniref:uncharacterized protein LOC124655407 n=1 Tax=Lolium rigidum TaxID=89674 RepID=UPI001F5C94F7|nr:uncharacterized protein LOC124655407 [Lolium rigidum]